MTQAEAVVKRLPGCGTVRAAGVLLALAGALLGQVTINEFSVPTTDGLPYWIAKGPDGNLWFTEFAGNKIGRITPGGAITEFTVPTSASEPSGITSGPDGNLRFAELSGNKIGQLILPSVSVPALSAWGLALCGILLLGLGAGTLLVRHRQDAVQ
jgi:virginiamycin B lyase